MRVPLYLVLLMPLALTGCGSQGYYSRNYPVGTALPAPAESSVSPEVRGGETVMIGRPGESRVASN